MAELTLISTLTQDWKPYLQYGDQSWKRLSDPVRRRDIGLFLVTEMIKHDPATQTVACRAVCLLGKHTAARSADQSWCMAAQVFCGDILAIWFDSIVARRLSAQHTLTTAMLNAESPSPLLAGLPFSRETGTGRYEVEQLDLLDKRLDVLKGAFNLFSVASAASRFADFGGVQISGLCQRSPICDQ